MYYSLLLTFYPLMQGLVAVGFRLVGTFDLDADIIGLLGRKHRQFRADLLKVQPRHFLVEQFGQNINADFHLSINLDIQSINCS